MKSKIASIMKMMLKVAVIVGVTAVAIAIASNYFDMDKETLIFVIGGVYILLGGSTLMGNVGRRTDINYLNTRSIGIDSARDNLENDQMEIEQSGSFLKLMGASGLILIIMGYLMR